MLLVDDLLSLVGKGFFGIFTKIHEMAEDELYSEEKIQEQILELQQLYDAGELGKEEYEKKEAVFLERLTFARDRA
ncbi:MAG: gas vesicle protein GvpG [bacterium]|nr:gas vesicle protein GvpG [bacterium]